MAQLQVSLRSLARSARPGDVSLEATFTNASKEDARLNLRQASNPALVLHILDEKGQRVLMPPPTPPRADDLGAGQTIKPGASVSITFAGFLDRSLGPGRYRIQYSGRHPALGGTQREPLESAPVELLILPTDFSRPIALPLPTPSFGLLAELRARAWHWLKCFIRRILLRQPCNRVYEREVDEPRTETITNAPPDAAAWNNTYGWRARFHVRVDEGNCRATVTVRVRINGTITAAQQSAWETAIENGWNNLFKLCCRCCCCSNGYTIVADIQFVTANEHQVVSIVPITTNMGAWSASDTVDVRHEFGHMLGALDEYYTVNGVDYGAGRQPGGTIMNNPANAPVAYHYDVVRAAVLDLLGTNCATRSVNQPC
jgi:hypothetical protein